MAINLESEVKRLNRKLATREADYATLLERWKAEQKARIAAESRLGAVLKEIDEEFHFYDSQGMCCPVAMYGHGNGNECNCSVGPLIAKYSAVEGTVLDDGFGNQWQKCGNENCGLQIVRPGKVQCACLRCDGCRA